MSPHNVASSITLSNCKMSPHNVASSITLSNFTVGRLYRAKKSDMPDSSPTPIFASDSDKIGSASTSH